MNKIKRLTLVFVYRSCKKISLRISKILLRREPFPLTSYMALTPARINKKNEYFRAMDFALSRKDVKNIAVTGAYGAGKSTVISSYMSTFRENKFINVSLAGFEMQGNGEPATSREVELSILQQILYKRNRDELPDSRIDRILNRNKAHIWRVFWSAIKVIGPVGALLSLIYYHKVIEMTGFPENAFSLFSTMPYLRGVLILILLATSLYFISECASRVGIFDKKIRLNKVALLSGEMELGSGESSSLLNNCLDEIVYFFSRMENYRVVIFEDLDRLKNPEIFVKLREINKIVNNNLSEETPLRFIYAVRDDIFSGADSRTKFFDFIIPVVPVMDSRNAFSLLNGKMKGAIPDGEECLRSTAAYVSDMRSLNNIINEFMVFSSVVDNQGSKINLYAMVFYKNRFSQDYALIDRKLSILYKIVYDYRTLKLHQEYFKDLDAELSALSMTLGRIENEKASTSKDVRRLIVATLIPDDFTDLIHLYRRNNGVHSFGQQYIQIDLQELIDNETHFMDILSSPSAVFRGCILNGHSNLKEIPAHERSELTEDYQKRVKLVGEERLANFKETQRLLREAKEKVRRRNAISLAELVSLMGRESFTTLAGKHLEDIDTHDFLSDEQKKAIRSEMRYGGFDALYLLLSRGYLDQDFMRSRSIFQEGGLSVNDNEFVKSVALGVSSERANADLAIDDVSKVVRELSAQHLLHYDAAMHHQVVAHMLKENDTRLDDMLATLFARSATHVISLLNLLDARFKDPDSFPFLLARALDRNGYLDLLISYLTVPGGDDSHRRLAGEVISLISPERSENREQYRHLAESLGTGIVHLFDPARLDAFLTHILSLNVSYDRLTSPLSAPELACVRFIGKHSLYGLTAENTGIVLAVELQEHGHTEEECARIPWTLARQHSPAVRANFEKHADEFVQNVFLPSDEREAAITEVLRLDTLSDDVKLSIITDMSFCLETLAAFPPEPVSEDGFRSMWLQDAFYRYDRIKAAWPELMQYITGDCDMAVLTGYMARHAEQLSTSGPEEKDGDRYDLLYLKVICNAALNGQDYNRVIKNVTVNTSHFDERISDEIILRLLSLDKITLTRDNFLNVSSNISEFNSLTYGAIASWLGHYQEEMMKDPDYYLCKEDEVSVFEHLLGQIMYSDRISSENKLKLYSHNVEYYREGDARDINLPNEIKISAFFCSSDEEMNLRLFTSLVAGHYSNRSVLASMAEKLSENELQKIFIQKTGATLSLNDRDNCEPLLEQLQHAGMIKSFEFRDDGKVFVSIRGAASDDDG
ncbi:hypothetical protein PUG46_15835 [Erwiniaceae bacterium L1_55_4]|nr:hypothetical protein [Erwiniaceae bacterium L1_55_4]